MFMYFSDSFCFISFCLFIFIKRPRCCARAFSVVESGGCFSLKGLASLLWSRGSRCVGFGSCGSGALECRLTVVCNV